MSLCVPRFCALVCAFLLTFQTQSTSGQHLLPYEPIQYLTSHLPSRSTSALGDFLEEASTEQAGSWISSVKNSLKPYLAESGTSVVLVRKEQVLIQERTKGLNFSSSIEIPDANLLAIVSIVLPILLESFSPEVLTNPLSEVLHEDDTMLTQSFLDIVNKLPETSLDKPETLSALKMNGVISRHYFNALLGSHAKEVWMDAYMAVGVSSPPPIDGRPVLMNFEDIIQISLTISHDSVVMSSAEYSERLPLDKDKYLFGWWLNCPKDSSSNCLVPSAPSDTIFTISPDLRLYITPSLELTLIIVGPGATAATQGVSYQARKNLKSIADILKEDTEIWNKFDPSTVAGSSERNSHSK